jgi:hypothetical protein
MLHLGAKALQSREMILDDIYLLRLNLLLHMTEDYFAGRDFSDLRRQIVLQNAHHIRIESVELGGCLDKIEETDQTGKANVLIDQCFYRSAGELAALMELIAKGQPLEDGHKNAMQEKVDAIRHIQNSVFFTEQLAGHID